MKRARFQVRVEGQGYSAQLIPASLDGYVGQGASALLRIQVQGGFSGRLTLAVRDGLTGAFVPWLSTNPATIEVRGNGEIPITFNIAQGAPLGSHSLKLALLGSQNQEVDFNLTVRQPTFQVQLSATSFSISPGGHSTATLTVTTEGGFSGQINLSLSGNGSGQFTLAPDVVNTSTSSWGLTLTASPSAAPGTYTLILNATSGGIVRQIPISITVPQVQ